jgi:hypothetical protein
LVHSGVFPARRRARSRAEIDTGFFDGSLAGSDIEQPAGVRANMKDSLSSLNVRASKAPVEKARVYLLLCFLHAVVQETPAGCSYISTREARIKLTGILGLDSMDKKRRNSFLLTECPSQQGSRRKSPCLSLALLLARRRAGKTPLCTSYISTREARIKLTGILGLDSMDKKRRNSLCGLRAVCVQT